MSLMAATLVPGLILLALGLPLFLGHDGMTAAFRLFPRSKAAALVFFGVGSAWFLFRIWHLSSADFGDYRSLLFVAFAAIAVLSFRCAPDFLAVRGLCVLVLVAASTLLDAAYMQYTHPQRLLMVGFVYAAIALAILLGAQPWRVRDFFEWLFARRARVRVFGACFAAYGLILCGVAFTY